VFKKFLNDNTVQELKKIGIQNALTCIAQYRGPCHAQISRKSCHEKNGVLLWFI